MQVLFVFNELASHALDCRISPVWTRRDERRKVPLADFKEVVGGSVLVIDLIGTKELA